MGKVNDWSKLSDEAVLSFAYVFSLFFFFTRFFEVLMARTSAQDLFSSYRVNPLMLFVASTLILVGGLYFFQVTGGIDAWFGNYSDTYLENKKGYGLLNFLLIMSSNFLAFVLGFYWRTQRRVSWFLILFVLLVLTFCAYIQGLKVEFSILPFFSAFPG